MGGSVKQSLTAANQPDPGAFRGKAKAMARPVPLPAPVIRAIFILEAGAHGGDSLAAAQDEVRVFSLQKSRQR